MINIVDHTIKISVRNLVEFILRSGDIDNRRGASFDKDAMQEGSRIHRKIQKQMGPNYNAEQSLKADFPVDEYIIKLEGRADGIITNDDEIIIDEIKSMYADISYIEEPFIVHKAQAMCYGYIYATQNQRSKISIQVTYCNIESEAIKRFVEEYTTEQLEEWIQGVLNEFIKWAKYLSQSKQIRNLSIKGLEFPFPYRNGQRKLAASVYQTISRRKTLFIQAPTGVGKTMSTIFPAVKAMGEELDDKIFYLTAKTITRTVAEEAFDILRDQGLEIKTVTITAKDKLCLCEETNCNPDACPYAKGHYDRVNQAVYHLVIGNDNITRDRLLEYAKKYTVCPLVAFCVLGGVFSEGIDLKYDRLIGTMIVGTGLPMVCNEREILKNYYDDRNEKGFDFSYLYPGMNKVLQAAGRVIRTEKDQGIILLLDERFANYQYRNLFPQDWEKYQIVNLKTIQSTVDSFWCSW